MDSDLEKYLRKIENKMKENETQFVAFIIEENKLVKIGNTNSKRKINDIVSTFIDEYELDENDVFVIINYSFTYTNFFHGPLVMTCEIKPMNSKGKISKKDTKVNLIYYLPSELKTIKFNKSDYKRLFMKMWSGEFESGIKKLRTLKDLYE